MRWEGETKGGRELTVWLRTSLAASHGPQSASNQGSIAHAGGVQFIEQVGYERLWQVEALERRRRGLLRLR